MNLEDKWRVRSHGTGPRIELVNDAEPSVWLEVVAVGRDRRRKRRQTADMFARAVNAHDALVKECEAALVAIELLTGNGCQNPYALYLNAETNKVDYEEHARRIRAALALARGES
jgi:hypothetical protein